MWGIDSFKRATIDMPKTHIWKQMKTMSSRFVFLTLYIHQSCTTVKRRDSLLRVWPVQSHQTLVVESDLFPVEVVDVHFLCTIASYIPDNLVVPLNIQTKSVKH